MSSLRLVNAVCAGSETIAIERDGVLLDVMRLEQIMDMEASPIHFTDDAGSFRHRVFSLGMAGLEELIEVLGTGDAPEEAVLTPSLTMILPPTIDTALLVDFESVAPMRFSFGHLRNIKGHDSPVRLPVDEPSPLLTVHLVAVLGDDVRDVNREQGERAIAGYSLLCTFTLPSRENRASGWGRYRAGQLGPWLVRDPALDISRCRSSIRINGEVLATSGTCSAHFGAMVSFASEGLELHAGDVIASPALLHVSAVLGRPLREGDRIDIEATSLGVLSGLIVTA